MKPQKRLLPALLVSLFAGVSAPAANAAQFSNVVVFGDSLSDAGYFRPFLLGLGLPPPLVATLGRFTTNPGPVWSELVSTYYGVTPAPSNAGGFIFAQGGARVSLPSPSTPPGAAQRPISTQITEYLSAHGGAADPQALYSVWGGANDFLVAFSQLSAGQITPDQLQANVLGAVGSEIQQVGRLYQAGARYVLAFNNYDPAATPAFAGLDPASRAGATQLAVGANSTFFSGLAASGLRVIPVDVFSLVNELRANPSAYGFTNITGIACGAFPPITTAATASSEFCYSGNLVAPNADRTYMFADGIHPTTATHQIFAQFAESLIEGPTQYSLLAEAPLRTRASHMRALDEGLLEGRAASVGKLNVFASADGGKFDIDSGIGNSGLNSDLSAGAVGVTIRASDSVLLGIAYGQARAKATFGQDAGSFRTREQLVSLVGSVRSGGLYGTAVLSVSNVDFRDMHRNIALGPAVRTADASTDGSNGSAYLSAGYDFPIGRFTIGPTVSVSMQNVTVNAFDETGAGSADLHIAQQTRHSEVWSGGVRASVALGSWTPWARVTADQERRDDARFVTASPLSLATGNSYDIAAYAPDRSFITTAIGVNGALGDHVSLGLAYFNVSGRSGIKEDGFSGVVSYRF